MAQMLSPGVYIEEIDASAITPSTSANVAFLGASYNTGPINQPYVVTNKTEYTSTFGIPTDRNYNEWFQGYKFLDYGNQLVITRAGMKRPDMLSEGQTIQIGKESPVMDYYAYDLTLPPKEPDFAFPFEYTSVESTTPAAVYSKEIKIFLKSDPSGSIALGNLLFLTASYQYAVVVTSSPTNVNGVYEIIVEDTRPSRKPNDPNPEDFVGFSQGEIEQLNGIGVTIQKNLYPEKGQNINPDHVVRFILTNEADYNKVSVGDYIRINTNIIPARVLKYESVFDVALNKPMYYMYVEFNLAANETVTGTINLQASGQIYPALQGHFNGATEAYVRGQIQSDNTSPTTNPVRPLTPNAIDPVNIDFPISVSGYTFTNPNRLNYTYDLIENEAEFNYQYDQGSLHKFHTGMKLKFFSRYASEEKIEIAIANYYDFWTDQKDNSNFAVAFEETSAGYSEKIYLRSLFEYAPLENEFAIAIKQGSEIETFIVSLDPLSVDGNNKSNYVETVINENSKLVYVLDNVGVQDFPATYLVQDRFGTALENPDMAIYGAATKPLIVQGGKNPECDEGSYKAAYESVLDKERYEIDVIIGIEKYHNIAIDLADTRKDCIAFIGTRYVDSVGYKANDAVNKILTWKKGGITNTAEDKPKTTMFAALFANYFRIFDTFNKKYRWINVAGDMAGIRCDVTSNNASWWVSAGMKRGQIRNINKLAFTPNQEQRDNMYKEGINPIVTFPGTGNLVWGNKTLHPVASSFDRINIRTLFNTLERAMAKAARSQVFEFNDPYTRNAILAMFNPYLATIKAGRGIVDYLVVCDETNNTPDVISRNELRVDIYIKPNYAAEMILLTFTNVGTRSFADVVGVA